MLVAALVSAQTVPPEVPTGFAAVQFVDAQHGWLAGAGGVWATADGGASWHQQAAADEAYYQVAALDAQHVWVGGEHGLLHTADGGAHWERTLADQGATLRLSIVAPGQGYVVVADSAGARAGRLLTTEDAGATWHARPTPTPVQALCFESRARGWISEGTAVWRTDDGGASWTTVFTMPTAAAAGGGPAPGFRAELACGGDGVVWALFETPGGMSQVGWALYRTPDAGATWTPLAASAQFFPATGVPRTHGGWSRVGLAAVDQATAYVLGVCAACSLPGTQELGTVSLAVSRDAGADWEVLPPVPDLSGPAALQTLPQASFIGLDNGWLVAASADRRLWTTRDGGRSWQVQTP